MQNVLSRVIEGDGWDSQSRQFHVAFDTTVFMFALWTHYLSEAGRGSVVGRVGGGLRRGRRCCTEKGQLSLVFTASSSLFTTL